MDEIIDKALAGEKLTLPEIETIYSPDAGPCVKSCQFCSFAKCSNAPGELKRTPVRAVLDYARAFPLGISRKSSKRICNSAR